MGLLDVERSIRQERMKRRRKSRSARIKRGISPSLFQSRCLLIDGSTTRKYTHKISKVLALSLSCCWRSQKGVEDHSHLNGHQRDPPLGAITSGDFIDPTMQFSYPGCLEMVAFLFFQKIWSIA